MSSDFLRWFSPSIQDESRSLFNIFENQSKKIHVLFVISEPLLENRTIQKSSEKNIKRFCCTVICQFINRKVSSKSFSTNHYNLNGKLGRLLCVQYKTALLIVWCSCKVITF